MRRWPVWGDVVAHARHVVDDEGRLVADIPGRRGAHRRDRPDRDVAGGRVERLGGGDAFVALVDVVDLRPQPGRELVQDRAPADGEHAVGQRFPIDPPFGLVAMAWRDDDFVQAWLHRVLPRLSRTEIAQHQRVLADIRARGYGAWRFDDTHQSLHHRLASVLASLEPTVEVSRQLTMLMTMVTLQSVTDALEKELASTEFVVLPIFGQDGQPEYQIEIHLGRSAGLTLKALDAALHHAQELLAALP